MTTRMIGIGKPSQKSPRLGSIQSREPSNRISAAKEFERRQGEGAADGGRLAVGGSGCDIQEVVAEIRGAQVEVEGSGKVVARGCRGSTGGLLGPT